MGAHVVFVLGFDYPLRPTLGPMIQAHGHLQLIGWTGLFIIAVSSHMLPRLTNTPVSRQKLRAMLWTILAGLGARTAAHLLAPFGVNDLLARALMAASGALELGGIALYLSLLFRTLRRHRPQNGALAASGIAPFLITTLVGWGAFAIGNLLLCLNFAQRGGLLLDQAWNAVVLETFIDLVLLPVCFAFSINTFPIFLRLRAPVWPVGRVAFTYSAAAVAKIVAGALYTQTGSSSWLTVVLAARALHAVAILWLLWELDLMRRKAPWFRGYREEDDREARPPRKIAADYGQFGNFELLLYLAYSSLCFAATADLLASFAELLGFVAPIGRDVTRHLYLLGFVTPLILGMAARMIPGFLGISRIPYPNLVRLSFAFILLAVLTRIVPPLFWEGAGTAVWRRIWGLSGLLALPAVICLAINLRQTARLSKAD